jgi:hypothetical protein
LSIDDQQADRGAFDDLFKLGAGGEQAAGAMEAYQGLDASAEFEAIDGLGEKVIGASGETLETRGTVIEGREHDHGDAGKARVGAQALTDGEAIEVGEHDVEQNEVRR